MAIAAARKDRKITAAKLAFDLRIAAQAKAEARIKAEREARERDSEAVNIPANPAAQTADPVKAAEKTKCDYFSKKLAINYPKRIEELERKVEFFESLYQGQLDANERLLLRADKLEAENKELKAKNEKLKAECNKYWCKADCNECDHRCRAWQNGFNAKGGNMSFDSVQMLRRIVEEVTPDLDSVFYLLPFIV